MRPLCVSLLAVLAVVAFGGCGSGSTEPPVTTASAAVRAQAAAATPTSGAPLTDWPEFGLDPQRSDATNRPTGITARTVTRLRARRIDLPGTVDSSPIYLHQVSVKGATRDVIVVTTTYGRTIAIDASTGTLLWTFTPKDYAHLTGGPQVTNTSPIADPDRTAIYAAVPDGTIHKLSLASGREVAAGAWPVTITRDPTREKLAAALNVDGPDVIATTGGYNGDPPTYQGHVVLLARASGSVDGVFNTLCADRRTIFVPTTCPQSDSAILSRGGAVVEPGGTRLLLDTGNASWNGSTDFGDSVLELTVPRLALRQAYTPTDQATLNSNDVDLGSGAPALLSGRRILLAGKDGILRVLDLRRLDGHPPGSREQLGGEVQTLKTPGGGELFTQPAVWHHGSQTTVFVTDFDGTVAYALRGGRLHQLWANALAGTSPIVAGGLLYVYDPGPGGIDVYSPLSGKPLTRLVGAPGHWNSPIVVDGHVIEPAGNANDRATTGTLELFTAP